MPAARKWLSIAALPVLVGSAPVGGADEAGYGDCATSRAGLGDALALKRAIVSEALRNSRGGQADRFFSENTVLVAKTDLARGRETVVVYVAGGHFCGTSGCNAFIFERSTDTAAAGVSYRLHARITPARIPIAKLRTSRDGWRDLGVTVSGGGINRAYMAKLATAKGPELENPTLASVAHADPGDIQAILIDRPGLSGQQCQLT